jgi:hypothetical protein
MNLNSEIILWLANNCLSLWGTYKTNILWQEKEEYTQTVTNLR